jgi:hypothetical protein
VHDGTLLRREGERENAYSIFSGALVRTKQAWWTGTRARRKKGVTAKKRKEVTVETE